MSLSLTFYLKTYKGFNLTQIDRIVDGGNINLACDQSPH